MKTLYKPNSRTPMLVTVARCVVFLLLAMVLFRCGEADLNDPIGINDAIPQKVAVTTVKNVSGGAIVSYKVPSDNNIAYIEAVYTIKGQETKKKGSFYTNSLELDGFPESKEYTVNLYSVSASEVRSEPVAITVFPEEPPYQVVSTTLAVESTWGGVKVTYSNPMGASLRLTFLESVTKGWEEKETVYTSLKTGSFYVRGLDNRGYTFGVVTRDRWENYSDTIRFNVTPRYEEQADFSKISVIPMPGDLYHTEGQAKSTYSYSTQGGAKNGFAPLFDGDYLPPFSQADYIYFMNTTTTLPQSFTFDLGQKYILSRFVFWTRSGKTAVSNNYLFDDAHVRYFELWGSNDPNFQTGSWDAWTKIGDFESVRPSGVTTPGASYNTEEDKALLAKGESFDMPEEITAYRYIRYKVNETWSGKQWWVASELQFYGAVAN